MKSFGGGRKADKVVDFELIAYDDGEERAFQFKARPSSLTADMLQMVRSMGRKGADEINIDRIVPMIRKLIVNNDGVVPSGWVMEPLPDDDDMRLEHEDPEGYIYKGPDGVVYQAGDQAVDAKWQDHSNWTSRRRWVELIEKDDELVVYAEDLLGIMKWLITEAGERPTQPRT